MKVAWTLLRDVAQGSKQVLGQELSSEDRPEPSQRSDWAWAQLEHVAPLEFVCKKG